MYIYLKHYLSLIFNSLIYLGVFQVYLKPLYYLFNSSIQFLFFNEKRPKFLLYILNSLKQFLLISYSVWNITQKFPKFYTINKTILPPSYVSEIFSMTKFRLKIFC